MKKPEPEMFILHIRDAILKIEKFTLGRRQADLDLDDMLLSAVAYQIIIIGEASGFLPKETTNEMPEIPWKDVVGTRHKVVHDYFCVDLKVVWDVVENRLPELKKAIERYIGNHPEVQKMDSEANNE